jgi:ribosomal protein S27AE
MPKCPKCGQEVPVLTVVLDATGPTLREEGKMCAKCGLASAGYGVAGISIDDRNRDKNKKKWQFWK